MNVYFDESGNTGSNLSSIDQPVYVLASHNVPENIASDYLSDKFGENRRKELKYTDIVKSRNGGQRIAEIIKWIDQEGFSRRAYAADKSYMLSIKLFDIFVETGMHQSGINAYENGYNVVASNLLHAGILSALGKDGLKSFQVGFEHFLKNRDPLTHKAFWQTFDNAIVPNALKIFRDPMRKMSRFGQLVTEADYMDLPKSVLSTGPSFLIAELVSWTEQGEKHISPIHDSSTAIEAAQYVNEHLRDPGAERKWIGEKGGPGHWHPLPMDSVALLNSKESASLQIADVLAGAYAEKVRATLGYTHREEIIESLEGSGLDEVSNHMWLRGDWKPPWDDNPAGVGPVDFMHQFFVDRSNES